MPRNPPQPIAQSFLLCRQVMQDRQSGEHIIIAPLTRIMLRAFPAASRFSMYLQLTGGHGIYRLAIQVRDNEGQVVGDYGGPEKVRCTDPLETYRVCWLNSEVRFPHAGRYDVIVRANGEDLAQHAIEVVLRAST